MIKVTKLLSANDTGETGGHQAGICVPKKDEILNFFPKLDSRTKNPRLSIVFHCKKSAERWTFNFIYYNNKFFGGTRNEYRLTGMTKFLRANNLVKGDLLLFEVNELGKYTVDYERSKKAVVEKNTLKIGSGWTVINI